jgi:hypothetical protein
VNGVKQNSTPDGIRDFYVPNLVNLTDFYSFGAPMPGRSWPIQTAYDNTSTGTKPYRYGFNGQEGDFEVYNSGGTSYTAEFWQYDSRLGRRWNVDPIIKPWESPYATFANNPIYYIDPNGADAKDWFKKIWHNASEFFKHPFDKEARSRYRPSGSQASSRPDADEPYVPTNGARTFDIVKVINESPNVFEQIDNEARKQRENMRGAKWENGDGYITVQEAINTWQYGAGKQNLYANINKLNLSKVHASDFSGGVGSRLRVNFAGRKYYTNPTQAIVYGSITLQLMENNFVFAPFQDKYDFDIKATSKSIERDFLTAWGNMYNGFGTPFYIGIYGTTKIKH